MNSAIDVRPSTTEDFWGELSPVEHSVQIYANDETFLGTLEAFVRAGLRVGESVVVITTLAHRTALEKRLTARGIDMTAVKARDQFITLDARTSLESFMVNGYPDPELFKSFVEGLLARAHANGGRVRAFGEMVAMLWAQGHKEATLQLEQFWDKFCEEKTFCLFCAYPKSGFTQDVNTSLDEICATHSKIIAE
jgi:MEDS: MEthanogen/methylotroph, DcmR Sensory domain